VEENDERSSEQAAGHQENFGDDQGHSHRDVVYGHSRWNIHSRPMATQQAEFRGELLFLTRQESSKTDEIAHQARVTLTYVDSKDHRFISLSGRAALSKDRATIHELWNPLYKAWFPEGENDPEITVIRVYVDHAEYWEAPANAIVRGYQLLKAAATKGDAPVGRHQEVAI